MLTLAKMSPVGAIAYYKDDNYYQQGTSEELSEWWGDGADELNLSGSVFDGDFAALCNGQSPDGEVLRPRAQNKDLEPIAGTDATFSAPKSVSMAALAGGDARLVEAHNKAVNVALQIMSDRYLNTQVGGMRVKAAKPIVAKFRHDTSRDLDPQLHTHCFWLNLVQSEDGKWRGMLNHEFYANKILMGQIYRDTLSAECQKLGYEIENRGDGLFEIKGYSRQQIETFSQRHMAILDKLKEEGLPDTTANRIYALFATRKAKDHDIDRGAMLDYWRRECDRLSITHPTPGAPHLEQIDLTERINQAVRHCEERKAIFTQEQLERFITETPTGYTIDEIGQAIAAHPKLISREKEYATEWSIEREKMTLALMESGKGTMETLAESVGELEGLTDSQAIAVRMAATSTDSVMAWVGVAGAGKTHSVNALLSQIGEEVRVRGFSPDSSGADTLQEETGLHSDTVASLLMSEPDSGGRQLWIVDEAGKLSAAAAYQLLQKAREENAQVLLIGDPKQLSAVEAGNPWKSLIENGTQQARLRDFRRQQHPILNRAVQMLYHDMGHTSLDLLKGQNWIHEQFDMGARCQAIATEYLNELPMFRPGVKVLAGTHAERELITAAIREGLKKEYILGATDYGLNRLRGKDLTTEQRQHARHYEVGDIVIPSRSVNRLRKSQVYRVTEVEGDRVTLKCSAHDTVLDFSTLKFKVEAEVYLEGKIDIAIGDRLKWTRNNRDLKRLNGKEFTVTGIDKDIVMVRHDNGKRDQFSLKQLQHVDHALVQTVYGSQGMTCDRVLVCMGNGLEVAAESILVAMSRARQSAEFFCASFKTLKERVDWSTSQRNPSELLNELGFKLKAPAPPSHIDLKHWIERIEGSGVLPDVAELNVESIAGMDVYERLLSTDFESLGAGQEVTAPMRRKMKAYAQVAEGGAWNSGGVDALSLPGLKEGDRPIQKLWGEFKADAPRIDPEKSLKKGSTQYRKYEAPLGEKKAIFLPEVPDEVANRIYQRFNVNPTEAQRASGFWACAYWYPEITVMLTEGKKKAEAIISQGYAAIALPSVTGGYRAKDDDGNFLDRRVLHPELQVFANDGRRFQMAFDQDTNRDTIQNVRRDMVRTGEALQFEGCPVDVIKWKNSLGKGADDFIVNQGPRAWQAQVDKAAPLAWESEAHYHNEYRKMSGFVRKTWGEAPDRRKLDVAIAISARPQDAPRILAQSPAAKDLRDSEEVLEYIQARIVEGDRIKVQLGQRVEAPRILI